MAYFKTEQGHYVILFENMIEQLVIYLFII